MRTKRSWEVAVVHSIDLEESLNTFEKNGLVVFQVMPHGTNGAYYKIVAYKIELVQELGEDNW